MIVNSQEMSKEEARSVEVTSDVLLAGLAGTVLRQALAKVEKLILNIRRGNEGPSNLFDGLFSGEEKQTTLPIKFICIAYFNDPRIDGPIPVLHDISEGDRGFLMSSNLPSSEHEIEVLQRVVAQQQEAFNRTIAREEARAAETGEAEAMAETAQ